MIELKIGQYILDEVEKGAKEELIKRRNTAITNTITNTLTKVK